MKGVPNEHRPIDGGESCPRQMMPWCSVEPVTCDPLAIAVIDWKKRRKRQRKKYQKDDPFVLRWPQKIEKHSPNNHTGHANCGEGLPKCSFAMSWSRPHVPSKSSGNRAPKIAQLLLLGSFHRREVDVKPNFAFANMERMLRVKISFVTQAFDGGRRGVKRAEPSEEILGRGGRGIDIGAKPELAAGLGSIAAIRALVGARERSRSHGLLRSAEGLAQSFAYVGRWQQRAEIGRWFSRRCRPNCAGACNKKCSNQGECVQMSQ